MVQNLAIASATSVTLSPQQAEFSKQFAAIPVKPMNELVQSSSPSLSRLDKQALSICIAAAIGKYLSFIGLPDAMTEEHTLETAQMMIDCHPHIQVDAIKSFFYECKRGTYGYHYNKMDGSKLLMWFDKFVEDYYKQIDDYEYAKHQNTKGDLANPANLTDEDGEPIDLTELLASFHGKTKEQLVRENLVKDIRHSVFKKNMHLYNEMSVEEADKIIEQAIIDEMKAHGLINF